MNKKKQEMKTEGGEMKHKSKNLIIFIFNCSGNNIICTVNPGSESEHKNDWHATNTTFVELYLHTNH